jgi:hypothetical protein
MTDQYQAVLALRPVGYWPADSGERTILRDLSTNQNQGKLFSTPWEGQLLDFSSAYQFVEIPGHATYFGEAFSVGVWVFSRRSSYGREGVAIIGSWPRRPLPVSVRLKGELGVEIVSNGMKDALRSLDTKVSIPASTWQHIAYTFKNGEGKLYINGKLAHAKQDVSYTPASKPHAILAGYDADWWGVHPAASQSLDGSLRHLVIFDRALDDAEVQKLAAATPPQATPHLLAADEVRIDGRFVALSRLGKESPERQRHALILMHKGKWSGDVAQNAAVLRPYLEKALRNAPLRYDAVLVLQKLGAFDILQPAVAELVEVLGNQDAAPAERASAALALGAMGGRARAATSVLKQALQAELDADGAHIPRVNEIQRNALLYALLRIHPDDPTVRKLLGQAFAKPILDKLDLQRPDFAKTRELAAKGQYMDALDTCKGVLKKNGVLFLSQNDRHRDGRGDIHDRSYTAMAAHKGYTYKFGEGKSYAGCETITQEFYEKVLARDAGKNPDAPMWLNGNVSVMRRANLQKIAPDGTVETVYIGGESFIFSAQDAKVRSWVVAIDKNGYIHVMGGQHNMPSYGNYMPGVWEKLGFSPDRSNPAHPTKMYWVSKRPEDITEFEFVGTNANPRDLPATYLNYMNFVQDNQGELYLYGRTNAWGFQSWGFFKYDADARTWSAVGGLAGGVVESAKAHAPQWMSRLYKQYRGSIPGEGGPRVLAWAWQPHFYDYLRSTRGVQFDLDNRMHVQIGVRGVDENARYALHNLFAYSDDGGQTFHRADGSPVKLPLTCNPAPEYDAVTTSAMNPLWIMQWSYLASQLNPR